MANNKKFVVKNGLQTQSINLVSSNNATINVSMLDIGNGTLSFSGNSGQLFSISDNLTGVIFSVNDISGIPSIEVYDTGKIILAETFGNVSIGTSTDNGEKVNVKGNVSANILKSTVTTGNAPIQVLSTTLVANLNADLLDGLNSTSFANTDTLVSAYNFANTVNVRTQSSYDFANTVNVRAQAAFNKANLVPAGSTTQVQFNDGGSLGANAALTFDKTNAVLNVSNINVTVNATFTGSSLFRNELFVNNGGGDEGGEIRLANAITNSTLSGPIAIDIYQNKIRFFETGGTNRGAFIDLSAASGSAGTDLLAGTGSGVTSVAGATGIVSNNTILVGLKAISSTNNITFDYVAAANNGFGENFKVGDDAWIGDTNLSNTIRIKGQQDPSNAYIMFGPNDGVVLGRAASGPLTYGGNTVWHAGNDGSGSGLDADLLDGLNSSSFANTDTLISAYNFANTVNIKVDSAYTFANTVNTRTQSAYDFANTVNVRTQSSYDFANTVNVRTQASFDTTNTAFAFANTVNVRTQSSYDFANTVNVRVQSSYDFANTVNVRVQSAFDTTNTSFSFANTVNVRTQSSYDFANTVNVRTQAAYNFANTVNVRVQAAYDTTNTAFNFANTVNVRTQSAYDFANTVNVRVQSSYDFGNTVNVRVQSSYDFANTVNVRTQAAFDKANTGTTSSGTINYVRKTTTYTAVAGDHIIADTSGGPFTITLPASPQTGNTVVFVDGSDWSANNLTIARNGSTIEALAEDLTVDINSIRLDLVYDGTTWEVYAAVAGKYIGYTANVGDGTNVSYTLTHNLGSPDVQAIVKEWSTGYLVYPDIKQVSNNVITLEFFSAPSSNQYKATIIGIES